MVVSKNGWFLSGKIPWRWMMFDDVYRYPHGREMTSIPDANHGAGSYLPTTTQKMTQWCSLIFQHRGWHLASRNMCKKHGVAAKSWQNQLDLVAEQVIPSRGRPPFFRFFSWLHREGFWTGFFTNQGSLTVDYMISLHSFDWQPSVCRHKCQICGSSFPELLR